MEDRRKVLAAAFGMAENRRKAVAAAFGIVENRRKAVAAAFGMAENRRKVVAAAFLAASGAVFGSEPLTLAEATRQALDGEPGTLALLEQAAAFDELAVAAEQLPDPQLRFGAANLPLEDGGFRTEGMSQAQLGVRQVFPPIAARSAARRRQQALAEVRRAEAEDRRRQVLLSVRHAWLDAYQEARSRRLVLDAQQLFANLVTITRSLYAVGGKNQQDLLRAELELSHLQARLIATEERATAARAELERWIAGDGSRSLAELQSWPRPPPLDQLRGLLAHHPALLAAAAEVAAGTAAVTLAQSRFRPNWTLDAAYGYRDGSLPNGLPRSDFFSVVASVSAPLFTAKRQQPALRAAAARRRGAEAAQDELRQRLDAELLREHRRWLHLGRRLALYDDAVLEQARAHAEASLAAYRSETADFADVMRSTINDLEVRLERVRLAVERRRSHAALAYLGGLELGPDA